MADLNNIPISTINHVSLRYFSGRTWTDAPPGLLTEPAIDVETQVLVYVLDPVSNTAELEWRDYSDAFGDGNVRKINVDGITGELQAYVMTTVAADPVPAEYGWEDATTVVTFDCYVYAITGATQVEVVLRPQEFAFPATLPVGVDGSPPVSMRIYVDGLDDLITALDAEEADFLLTDLDADSTGIISYDPLVPDEVSPITANSLGNSTIEAGLDGTTPVFYISLDLQDYVGGRFTRSYRLPFQIDGVITP